MFKLIKCVFMICISTSCFSQSNWELAKEEKDIQIYKRSVKGYSVKEYKVVSTIKTSLEHLVDKITDGDNLKKWTYQTAQSKLLFKESDSVFYVYMFNDFTWPIKNRDHISKLELSYIDGNTIKITISSAPKYIPVKSSVLRVEDFSGFWMFERKENGIQVTQQMKGDPSGYLPAFIVNAVLVKAPYHTMKKLKEQLENQ